MIRPVVETLLGHLEMTLFTSMEDVPGELEAKENPADPCSAIFILATNKQNMFAKELLGRPCGSDRLTAAFEDLQWITDRRKTKADTEERSL